MRFASAAAGLLTLAAATGAAGAAPTDCSSCAVWNAPQAPFHIYGNTWYVGTHSLSAILIASDKGHILIDGDLEESVPQIADHIRALGFRLEDVKWILNSHVHYDHAGGIAELQRLTGAVVMASPWTAAVMGQGEVAKDDPQFGVIRSIPRVKTVRVLADGDAVRQGPLALTAHFTPGHTPGGTSWSWISCEAQSCLHMVYADSLTAVSADAYRFTDHPGAVASFEKSITALSDLPCDILLTPHPEFSGLLDKAARKEAGEKPDPFVAPDACNKLADASREALHKRVATEGSAAK